MRLARTPWQLFWRRFRDDKLALASLVFLALLILVAIFAPFVVKLFGAPADYNYRDTAALDPLFATATGPSSEHLFGVDQLGRDVFTRTIYGARVSLVVAFASTILATTLGVVAGLLAGYFRGWTDTFISRSIEVLLAIPYLLLATGLAAACTLGGAGCLGGLIKPGLGVVIFVIAITAWTYMARIVRGQTLSLREKEFIEASRAAGSGELPDHLPRAAAEPDGADHRLGLDPDPPGDPLRGRALVPRRRRHQPAELGPDDLRRHPDLQLGLVVHVFPRSRPPLHRARLQPRRRRDAGRAQPAHAEKVVLP